MLKSVKFDIHIQCILVFFGNSNWHDNIVYSYSFRKIYFVHELRYFSLFQLFQICFYEIALNIEFFLL